MFVLTTGCTQGFYEILFLQNYFISAIYLAFEAVGMMLIVE